MRRAYVDLGASVGDIAAAFGKENPGHDIYCIEPNPSLLGALIQRSVEAGRYFNVIWAAAWVHDGVIDLFQSASHLASTVVPGKVENADWPQINYAASSRVPSMDFSAWLRRTLGHYDEIVVKMDVEGAEYAILDRMIADRTLGLVTRLLCEWHVDRYPAIGQARHDDLYRQVHLLTKLEDWH